MSKDPDISKIDAELRSGIMSFLFAVAGIHTELREDVCKCHVCESAGRLLGLLDAEQRQYGPAISETDPSFAKAAR